MRGSGARLVTTEIVAASRFPFPQSLQKSGNSDREVHRLSRFRDHQTDDGRSRRRLCLDLRDRIERTRSDCVENRFGARLEGGLGSRPTGDRFDLGRSIDAGRDHGHPDGVAEIGVEGCAHDDVGFVVDLLADSARGLVQLVERRSLLPLIETSRPRAPRIEDSSSSGRLKSSSVTAAFGARREWRLVGL